MKKIITLLTACIAFAGTGIAQENNNIDLRNKLQFGLKVGANYSNVYDTKGEEFQADAKFGFVTGGYVEIPISKYFGVHPEFLFSQKGFHAKGRILGGTYDFTRTTNYIDIPLFLTYKPSEFFSLMAGPQYSYLIKQKDVFANGATTIAQEQEFENDNVRKNILCFVGGFDINARNIVFSARVGWDIQNNNGDGTSTTPRYKNVWYQATIGYRFHTN